MSLRKKLDLNWQGKEYSLLVTMAIVDDVDSEMSLGVLVSRQLSGDVRFSHVAKFISLVLNHAGASTTQESVYENMFSDGATSMLEANTMLSYLLSAFFPEPKKKDSGEKAKK